MWDWAETLGDRVREVLGERALAIEDLAVLSETPMEQLPARAVERIGIQPGQVNLLVRMALRHPTRTLTDHVANLLRDEVYAHLHKERCINGPPGRQANSTACG